MVIRTSTTTARTPETWAQGTGRRPWHEIVPTGSAIDLPGVDPLKYQRPAAPSAAAAHNEAMTVKLRYKQPDGNVSALFSAVVMNRIEETPELGFASAVAEFGMLLRGSEFKGAASFADVRSQGPPNSRRETIRHGHRAEFISLIDAAERVNRLEAQTRIDGRWGRSGIRDHSDLK